jgi:hypothetical protein
MIQIANYMENVRMIVVYANKDMKVENVKSILMTAHLMSAKTELFVRTNSMIMNAYVNLVSEVAFVKKTLTIVYQTLV